MKKTLLSAAVTAAMLMAGTQAVADVNQLCARTPSHCLCY